MAAKKTEKTVVTDTTLQAPTMVAPEQKPVDTIPTALKNTRTYVSQVSRELTFNDKENGQPLFVDRKALYTKLCIPHSEALELLGGHDPNIYFRDGLVHQSFLKTFGKMLDETNDEVKVLREVIPFKDVLLFKQKWQNIYIVLIPKKLSSEEIDENDEFMREGVNYDIRGISFTGTIAINPAGSPSAFEEHYFKTELKKILQHLLKVAEMRKYSR